MALTSDRLLANTIYAGTFTWQGSAFCRAKAKRSGRTLEPRTFDRPHLRVVDDETWNICNDRASRPHRGGRRHLLAGLLSCGECSATLTVKVARGRESAYCASCATAKGVGAKSAFLGYVSTMGARKALEHVLERIFCDKATEEFKRRLRERLGSGREQEKARVERALAQVTRACERLARHLRDQCDDDPILDREYKEASAERRRLERELRAFNAARPSKDERAAVEQQLRLEPLAILRKLLNGEGDLEKMQAVLSRLFPRIALVARPRRHAAVYTVEVAAGAGFALAAETKTVIERREVMKVEVQCSAHRPTRWLVRTLESTAE